MEGARKSSRRVTCACIPLTVEASTPKMEQENRGKDGRVAAKPLPHYPGRCRCAEGVLPGPTGPVREAQGRIGLRSGLGETASRDRVGGWGRTARAVRAGGVKRAVLLGEIRESVERRSERVFCGRACEGWEVSEEAH